MERKFPSPLSVFFVAAIARIILDASGKPVELPPEAQSLSLGLWAGLLTSISTLIIFLFARLRRPDLLPHALALSVGFSVSGRMYDLFVLGRNVPFELVYGLVQLVLAFVLYHYFVRSLRKKSS